MDFFPSHKEERRKKMDENGGEWIRKLSLRKTNIAWILSFVEPRFSINMWDCVCIFDMNLEMKQSKETIGK